MPTNTATWNALNLKLQQLHTLAGQSLGRSMAGLDVPADDVIALSDGLREALELVHPSGTQLTLIVEPCRAPAPIFDVKCAWGCGLHEHDVSEAQMLELRERRDCTKPASRDRGGRHDLMLELPRSVRKAVR